MVPPLCMAGHANATCTVLNILSCAGLVALLSGVDAGRGRWPQKPFFDILTQCRAPFLARRDALGTLIGAPSPDRRSAKRKTIPVFAAMRQVEGEGHGLKDASHTWPWHSLSAAAGILCAAIVTDQRAGVFSMAIANRSSAG